ncbi:TIGR02588 family protein [Nodosilinea nodulosa]|uniref:TIGR02588 family protein n=1 Tax=Nodosilinea nodulosa TaxID=416001 RepID=UPI0002E712B2
MQEETGESIELAEAPDKIADAIKTHVQQPSRSVAEWISFGFSLLVVGAIAGLVVFSWSTEGDRPPSLTLKPGGKIRQENQQFYVPFELTNTGGETAESVQVSAELKINGEVEESGNVEIDFLARDETAEGAFVFNQNPDQGELVLRVSSYKKP